MGKFTVNEKIDQTIEATQKDITEIINDVELKKIVLESFVVEIKGTRRLLAMVKIHCVSWMILAAQLKDLTLKDFTWQLLCKLYNLNYPEFLEANLTIFKNTPLADMAEQILIGYINKEKAVGWQQYYRKIQCLFLHLSGLDYANKYPNIRSIKVYKNMLGNINAVNTSKLEDSEEIKFIRNNVTSNYPLNSDYKQMIQVIYIQPGSEVYKSTNFNTRTDNEFMQGIFKEFLKNYSDQAQLIQISYKLFIYYFQESLGDETVNCYEDFTEEMCIKQFKFYNDLDQIYLNEGIVTPKTSLGPMLIMFYRYLIDVVRKKKDKTLFSKAFEDVLGRKFCPRILRSGCVPLFYNRNEAPPKSDKFCILPNSLTTNNSSLYNNNIISADLTLISLKYRQDVKELLWYGKGQISHRLKHLYLIVEFLKYKETFDKVNINIVSLNKNDNKEFSDEFLQEYRTLVEAKSNSGNAIKGVLKPIRAFLKYHSKKYRISKNSLRILSLSGLSEYKGGRPITTNDLKVIYEGFKQKERSVKEGRLYTIVFEIFINTNLRIGEILNLKRDCLDDPTGNTATLTYVTKTSEYEEVTQEVNKIIIMLIEEAKKFTEQHMDGTPLSKNIFILSQKRKILKRCKRISFYDWFKQILESEKDKLEIKDYVPYNVRHTFVHNVHEEGVKEGLSLSRIARITGISFKTALRHYRDFNDIDNYVEAMSGVTITNVDIHGTIIDHEDDSINKPVKNDLGKCTDFGCNFELAECLMCRSFVTFPNRIPAFENLIQNYNEALKRAQNEQEVEEINIQKKLLAKYLSELYKFKEKKAG